MGRIVLSILMGLMLGLAIGLIVGWWLLPVQSVGNPMHDMSRLYKDEYTLMVAQAYQVDNDLNAAIERLKPLGVDNVFLYVRDVTERYISQSGTGKESDIRNLVVLSCAMNYCDASMQPFLVPTAISNSGS